MTSPSAPTGPTPTVAPAASPGGVRLRIAALFILLGILALGSDLLRSGNAAAQGREAASASRTPTQTPTCTPTSTPTASGKTSPTPTATTCVATPTRTPTRTPSGKASPTPTPATASQTPTRTPTSSPTASGKASPTPTAAGTSLTPTVTLTPTPMLSGLTFQTVASGFYQPLFITHAGDQSGRLFVVQRGGLVRIVSPSGSIVSPEFLNASSLITTGGAEQGMLGMAFHPDYVNNGLFYVTYNNPSGAIVLARYRVSTTNPDMADPSTASVLLTIPKPQSNHNGGMIAFGDDGMLYMSTGDGGGSGDPLGSGQSLTTLLGKILRLDVDSASPYAVPTDNPFFNDPDPAVREEIWAYGFRNPWRFSFDRGTGDLWIGDVGQSNREEVDFEASTSSGGLNYGWNVMEGTLCFNPPLTCNTAGKKLPVIDYATHDTGNCAVTGGYIYRGSRYPSLWGVYFYADYCSGKLWGLSQTTPGTWTGGLILDTSYFVSSFGEDQSGELYLTDYTGGRVVRIQGSDPAPTPTAGPP